MCQRLNDISIEIGAVENKIDYRFSHLKIEKGTEIVEKQTNKQKSTPFHLMTTFCR